MIAQHFIKTPIDEAWYNGLGSGIWGTLFVVSWILYVVALWQDKRRGGK